VSGVRPVVSPEGLSHIVQGGSTLWRFKNAKAFGAESSGAYGLDEGTKNSVLLASAEVVEEDIIPEANGAEVLEPAFPAAYLLLVGAFGDSVVSGCSRSFKVSQEEISFGSGSSRKPFGTCSGQEVRMRATTSLSVR